MQREALERQDSGDGEPGAQSAARTVRERSRDGNYIECVGFLRDYRSGLHYGLSDEPHHGPDAGGGGRGRRDAGPAGKLAGDGGPERSRGVDG